MIEKSFQEVHSKSWLETHIVDVGHELFVVRQVVPWQKLVDELSVYYHQQSGRFGKHLRMMVSVLILQKLRVIGDQAVIDLVKENRYAQHFCNVPDEGLSVFLERSTIVKFRSRIGVKGCQMIESISFERLRQSGAIVNDASLMDSSVLANNLIYPNDVDLIYKAFEKMGFWAEKMEIPLWWDHAWLKKRWRTFNLGKKKKRLEFLLEFQTLFTKASKIFQKKVYHLKDSLQKKQESIG